MSHHEEHHDSHGSNLPFSRIRLIVPGVIFMLLMLTYSAWGRCCKDECCKSECKKECSDKKCEHGHEDKKCEHGHDEGHEDHGGGHH